MIKLIYTEASTAIMEVITLDTSQEKYQIFDYLLEGCQIIDLDMRYIYLNDAATRHSKYNRHHLLGRAMVEVYPGIEKTEMFKKLQICMCYGMPSRLINEFEYPDHSKGWFELVMQKIPEGVLILSNDITERILGEEELRVQNNKLRALREIDLAILKSTDFDEVLHTICQKTLDTIRVDAVDILIFDPATIQLSYLSGHGFYSKAFKEIEIQLDEKHLSMFSHRDAKPFKLMVDHFDRCEIFKERLNLEQIQSCYVVPLRAKNNFIGLFEGFIRGDDVLDEKQLDFLEAIANQATVAIENHKLFESIILKNQALLDAYDSTIEGWSRALEFRDNETEGHTLRVTEMALAFAKSLNLKDFDFKFFKYGCLMHDIGKIGVPDDVLRKPGPLTDEEWAVMRKHPEIAKQLLKPISFLETASEIPYYHHEWVDGSGYPNGVKGHEIPLSSRIFSIIDVYDALTSNRPYRDAWTHEATLAYIVDLAGKQFDAELVAAFVAFIETYER